MIIGSRDFDLDNNTYIMGILNVTPDSFSDGGAHNNVDNALRRTGAMIAEGADIIDIGGESTRPGSDYVSADQEMDRIIPVLDAIRKEYDIPVSIDTYKAETAEESLKHGADIINDIWGLKYDRGGMAATIAKYDVPCVLMHNRKAPDTPKETDINNRRKAVNTYYEDIIPNMLDDLKETLDLALKAGIKRDKIILDPGVGFGKTYEDNLAVLNNLDKFMTLNCPVLLGCSRKSVIGNALNLPVDDRLEGTLVTTMLALNAQYSFVRVHDIRPNRRVIDMYKIIRDSETLTK
jgi:dihydropteroate synthase